MLYSEDSELKSTALTLVERFKPIPLKISDQVGSIITLQEYLAEKRIKELEAELKIPMKTKYEEQTSSNEIESE
jgi:hypothetical protein